jgi:hypothetical protein
MHANVTIRSNVFVRGEKDLAKDTAFISQVRGHSALLRLLARLAPNEKPAQSARRYLTRQQLAQVAWQARCSLCDGLPEGPVSCNGAVEIQFRCPRHSCTPNNSLPRTVLIDVELVKRSSEVLRKSFSEIVQDALRRNNGHHHVRPGGEHRKRVRIPIRLSLSQWHFCTDDEIEMAVEILLAGSSR